MESVAGTATEGRLGSGAAESVAALLGEKSRTVSAWYRRERIPCFRSASNIVAVSQGVVDYNGIFAPFDRAAAKLRGVAHGVD